MLQSLDITDPELVVLCDGSIVNEAVLFKNYRVADGAVRFGRIWVGRGTVLEPQVVLCPGCYVPPRTVAKAMSVVTDRNAPEMGGGVEEGILTLTPSNDDYTNRSSILVQAAEVLDGVCKLVLHCALIVIAMWPAYRLLSQMLETLGIYPPSGFPDLQALVVALPALSGFSIIGPFVIPLVIFFSQAPDVIMHVFVDDLASTYGIFGGKP